MSSYIVIRTSVSIGGDMTDEVTTHDSLGDALDDYGGWLRSVYARVDLIWTNVAREELLYRRTRSELAHHWTKEA